METAKYGNTKLVFYCTQ